jgi:hypothetical protein
MSLNNFKPTIWSNKLLTRLQKDLVFASVVNRDYEGEISGFGDTVKINEIGDITVSSYTSGASLTWQSLTDAQKLLLIDQAKTFSFSIDNIDAAQANPKVMNAAMQAASYAVADTIDQFIAGLYGGAGITNTTYMGSAAAPISTTTGNVLLTLSYIGRYMDEKNVPKQDRFLLIPPWFHQKLVLTEVGGLSATAVPKVFSDDVLSAGYVGQVYGFNLLVSNNVTNTGSAGSVISAIMGLNRTAISYAGQISKIAAVERESYFDEGIKGLYVYGAKVVRPDALAVAYVTEAAG